MADPIPFIDLQAQRRRLGEPLNKAIAAAVEGGAWIMGPQVATFEKQLAEFAGVKHAIACANGTDALSIVLRAWDIGPGDAVFVPAFTFAASAEVVALVGASPVFVDVLEDTYNIDPASLEAAIALVKREGKLKLRAVMPVDLFGQPADYRAIEPIAKREGLKMLCDTAQAFGATYNGRVTGNIGDAAATSFFPAKPLGCYGDGGASFTNDDGLSRSAPIHPQPWARRGPLRECPDRHEFASRHDSGGHPDREIENLPGRDPAARSGRAALQRRSGEIQPHYACRASSPTRNRPGRNI